MTETSEPVSPNDLHSTSTPYASASSLLTRLARGGPLTASVEEPPTPDTSESPTNNTRFGLGLRLSRSSVAVLLNLSACARRAAEAFSRLSLSFWGSTRPASVAWSSGSGTYVFAWCAAWPKATAVTPTKALVVRSAVQRRERYIFRSLRVLCTARRVMGAPRSLSRRLAVCARFFAPLNLSLVEHTGARKIASSESGSKATL